MHSGSLYGADQPASVQLINRYYLKLNRPAAVDRWHTGTGRYAGTGLCACQLYSTCWTCWFKLDLRHTFKFAPFKYNWMNLPASSQLSFSLHLVIPAYYFKLIKSTVYKRKAIRYLWDISCWHGRVGIKSCDTFSLRSNHCKWVYKSLNRSLEILLLLLAYFRLCSTMGLAPQWHWLWGLCWIDCQSIKVKVQ